MSLWSKLIGSIDADDAKDVEARFIGPTHDVSKYVFVDTEVGVKDKKIHDIGALRNDDAVFHSSDRHAFDRFIDGVAYICGHNIVHHDAKYLFGNNKTSAHLVDTLYVSPLLFPERPYHHLLKDDKLICEQMNNPVNDCKKARDLLMDEISRWNELSESMRRIYSSLLVDVDKFEGFIDFVAGRGESKAIIPSLIRSEFRGKICEHADIDVFVNNYPVELSYALSLISTMDYRSVTPPWVLHNYPYVEHVVRMLRHTRCRDGCDYCNEHLDVHHNLKVFFGFDQFRTYEGDPLQEKAARAAVEGRSLLAIFPTGGGKSLTFQLPALMEGRSVHGLTVVISPLQSLMKDQVDNLSDRGITDAVTINGMLDPISRSLAIQRVKDGDSSLLYIAPEMLRSKTIEKILLSRHVVRFVIDEAHCFSSWGQDFRVDYLYIGKFIKDYQEKKHCSKPIPVSCFTATAKQKVVQDICDYFKQMLDLDLEIFATSASRTNLRYSVIHVDTDEEKYVRLRSLISTSSCPTIVYVSRTKRTIELAQRLTRDGYGALPFNGRMSSEEKISNQDAFMSDKVSIIVATSAFGMGVDKKDVGLVVHYDISDSLENYVQEAGRAGRDPHLQARCFVLYSDSDLDKHFILLNQTKLSISEIQQVWKAVKDMTRQRMRVCCSALEIARRAGWDDSVSDIETRVRTALSALEQAGYIDRGSNVPHVYATGITVKNVEEARKRLTDSLLFEGSEVETAVRIIKSLISQKNISKAQDSEAESRVDYLADILGLNKREVVSAVERMRQDGILADTKDISAFLYDTGESEYRARRLLDRFVQLERYVMESIPDSNIQSSYKQLNDGALTNGIGSATEKNLRTILNFLVVKGYIHKNEDSLHVLELKRQLNKEISAARIELRFKICRFAIEWLYNLTENPDSAVGSLVTSIPKISNPSQKNGVHFSIVELLNDFNSNGRDLFHDTQVAKLEDIEEALLYLSKIGALKLEGGFLVLYNAMEISRKKDNKLRYKQEDYRMLNEFYKQKIQQVHIVGEYANLMVKDYDAALQYVQDYFQMDYKRFVAKYFKGNRLREIERNLTPAKYDQLFGSLSIKQMEIISDRDSRCIVVAAGPGSGKTKVLVHKLASLLLLEDVKHEQLLMLTFSRAAAIEFKQRLMDLIGNAAHFVEIKTFHSYCFDLLGRIGNLDEANDVVATAAKMISDGEVEPNRVAKTVLVIDEAQDMGVAEYELVRALIDVNEEMRVIAVGDDDQNIYEFRGSDSRHMAQLLAGNDCRLIEMTENYRSSHHVVSLANSFVRSISGRMKRNPIISMSPEDGYVSVTHHVSEFMYEPLISEVLSHHGQGRSCILTQTNDEAVILVALLHKFGIHSKLIQSMDGFRFWNLAEVRLFLKYLETHASGPHISDELWDESKRRTRSVYSHSESMQYLERCIKLYEDTNKEKFLTDFKEFVFESSVEDFCDVNDADIVVSTIHKSKGREFDDVYMLINEPRQINSDVLRRYYVGMTRAKRRLFIHTNGMLFDGYGVDRKNVDNQSYTMPDEVVLQLSHRDVNLGFFKTRKKDVLELRSGDRLVFENNYLLSPRTNFPVCQLSQKMQEELLLWYEKQYCVVEATVRFIVSWRPKDASKDETDYAVSLVDLRLQKEII